MIFKAINDWIEVYSTFVPREKKPILEIAKEDLKKFRESQLWKEYQEARCYNLVAKIPNPERPEKNPEMR